MVRDWVFVEHSANPASTVVELMRRRRFHPPRPSWLPELFPSRRPALDPARCLHQPRHVVPSPTRTATPRRHRPVPPGRSFTRSLLRRRSMTGGTAWRPLNRRGFLTVGAMGFGLTLGDFFRLEARADLKNYAPIAAKADSVIHIFLPGGIAHQETFDPKPFAPIEYRGEMGSIADQDRRRAVQRDACPRPPRSPTRSDRHPLDDARRGRPRARHAQHVHGLSAQPGAAVSEHGKRRLPRVRPEEQPAAVRLRSEPAERVRGHRLPELVVLAVQPRAATRPTAASRFRT